jgi:hypothetical protein
MELKEELDDSDAFDYWKNVPNIVGRFLPAPPSSVESERIFSKLTEIYRAKRSMLSSENALRSKFFFDASLR